MNDSHRFLLLLRIPRLSSLLSELISRSAHRCESTLQVGNTLMIRSGQGSRLTSSPRCETAGLHLLLRRRVSELVIHVFVKHDGGTLDRAIESARLLLHMRPKEFSGLLYTGAEGTAGGMATTSDGH